MFLGNLFYVTCLLLNAVSILSEDRFLARINLSPTTYDPAFGTGADAQSVRAKVVHLIASIRTLMRSSNHNASLHYPWRLTILVNFI
ncbi:hypothetical protein DL764_009129 [Monosporascus ibericus]|uniref:Uncharacterized protein n=1 Tax=Monosporascus ibericus TaxID=155417 RepID=A0A4Q4SYJ5_9PEZI|nr:hypothetical protein DL764_009129 [Monosporascus ibericus]